MWLIIVIGVWGLVAACLFAERYHRFATKPWAYSRRHEGLISFTDKEVFWITIFWPLAGVVWILFFALIYVWVWAMMFKDWVNAKHTSK